MMPPALSVWQQRASVPIISCQCQMQCGMMQLRSSSRCHHHQRGISPEHSVTQLTRQCRQALSLRQMSLPPMQAAAQQQRPAHELRLLPVLLTTMRGAQIGMTMAARTSMCSMMPPLARQLCLRLPQSTKASMATL